MSGNIKQTDTVSGIARTFGVFANTRNRAMLSVLAEGFKSSRPEVRAAAIRAAIRRHDSATHTQLIRNFASLAETDQALLCAAHIGMPHHAAPALRSAVLKADATLCKNACRIIALSRDFELFSVLLKAAENRTHRHRTDVAATILELATALSHKLAQWAGGDRTDHHDPSFTRRQVVAALEQSLSRFANHRCQEMLDAFLLLSPIENKTLCRILHDPSHPCHQPVMTELSVTQDFGIVERLVEALRDTDAPAAALDVISRRSDRQFVDILLHGLKRPVPIRVLHNMTRLSRIAWLEEYRERLLELDGSAQAIAIELATASGMTRDRVFELLAFLLQNGLAEGRRASCQALTKFDSPQADELVRQALNDPDAGVQATAVRQLRSRHMPEALQLLVALLDSPASEIRDAARSSLAEFNFMRFRTMFDLLDEQSARTTGVLVHKIDPTALQKLAQELSSPSITTKLRAIEMAIAMDAVDGVRQQLIELAGNDNVAVRKEAVAALAQCSGPEAVAALGFAASDPNTGIAEVAARGLAQRHSSELTASATKPFAENTT